jgi:activated RNA polymerase II transcriptional coactivator p15
MSAQLKRESEVAPVTEHTEEPEVEPRSESVDPNADKWVTTDEMAYYPLSRMRRVSVNSFRGKQLVNIREYYTDSAGDTKPGRKGISLSVEQYEALKEALPAIDRALNL